MSIEFFCSNPDWSEEDWKDSIYELLESKNLELLVEPEIDDNSLFLVFEKSIRGLLIEPENKKCYVRLSAFFSKTDWEIAGIILSDWVEEGTKISWDYENKITHEYLKSSWNQIFTEQTKLALRVFKKQKGPIHLGIYSTYLTLSFEDINSAESDKEIESLLKRLEDRAYIYNTAYPASTMVLNNDKRMAVWSLVPTLTNKNVDYINVYFHDNDKSSVIPIETIKKILGSLFEETYDSYFFPELPSEKNQKIINALLSENVQI